MWKLIGNLALLLWVVYTVAGIHAKEPSLGIGLGFGLLLFYLSIHLDIIDGKIDELKNNEKDEGK